MQTPGLLYGFDVTQEGRAGDVVDPNPGAYRWLHWDLNHPSSREWLFQHLEPLVAQSLTQEETRPRCLSHGEGVLLNLRGVNLNPDSDPEDMVSIRLWVTAKQIISVRLRRLMAVSDLAEQTQHQQAPLSVQDWLIALIQGLSTRIEPVVGHLADTCDELESSSLSGGQGVRRSLAELRQTTIRLRRHIGPQREALGALQSMTQLGWQREHLDALRQATDQITRIMEELDAVRERSAIIYDQLSDQRAEEMNHHMLVLSVIAAIFLPLGFLTGLLGVNVGGVPGADEPQAFGWVSAGLVVMGVGLGLWFKRNRWI